MDKRTTCVVARTWLQDCVETGNSIRQIFQSLFITWSAIVVVVVICVGMSRLRVRRSGG